MDKKKIDSIRHIHLEPENNEQLAKLCGVFNDNLTRLENHLGVEICNYGHNFDIIGNPKVIDIACDIIKTLYRDVADNTEITAQHIQLVSQSMKGNAGKVPLEVIEKKLQSSAIKLPNKTVTPRTSNQRHFTKSVERFDINFGVGPAGTGKTYLAVAAAISAYEREDVRRIVLTRPAVEAGENLGFLPGDLTQKIDPYLRPLYDALYELAGAEKINKLISNGIIEIAPLAFMRGRTLNDSFIILDEGQNTTKEQIKMFLTRIGFGSKAVITGDITQVDLPQKTESGLRNIIPILKNIPEIQFTFFDAEDVVRHPLVQKIIEAYEQKELKESS